MAIDKAVDSAVLDAGLLAVANAIRARGGTTGVLNFPAGFVDAIEAISVGGGGGSAGMLSGSFTPAENTLNINIDTGCSLTMLLLLTHETVTGSGVKAAKGLIFDKNSPQIILLTTNNSGSSYSLAVPQINHDNGGAIAGNGNCKITVDGTVFSVNSTLTSGTTPGHFLSGITYRWYAW